jgi:hypothetical protein
MRGNRGAAVCTQARREDRDHVLRHAAEIEHGLPRGVRSRSLIGIKRSP